MAHLPFDVLLMTFCLIDDCLSLNETGLLPEMSILAATLVHFHRFICTTIMRVRMTQIRVAGAIHCINNLSVTLAGIR